MKSKSLKLNLMLILTTMLAILAIQPAKAKAEVKDQVYKTTWADTTGTSNTVTMAMSGTVDKMFIKIPKVDAAVRYAFEDGATGYRFLSGSISGSASSTTTTVVDFTNTTFSGSCNLIIYCDRASADTLTTVTGKIIFE